MLPGGKELHQSVAAETPVQREGQPDHCRGSRYPEADTRPLPDARRVHDDEHHEHGKQPESENEKVLGTEPFELHLTAHAFVYLKVRHKLLSFICS